MQSFESLNTINSQSNKLAKFVPIVVLAIIGSLAISFCLVAFVNITSSIPKSYSSVVKDAYYVDRQNSLSILNLESKQALFQAYNKERPLNFGTSSHPIWLKIERSEVAKGSNYYVHIPFALMDSIHLIYKNHADDWVILKDGTAITKNERHLQGRHILFPLDFSTVKNEEVYLRFESKNSPLLADVVFIPKLELYSHFNLADSFFLIFFTVLFVMFLYHLILFAATQQKMYFFYIGQIACQAYVIANLNGYLNAYLLGDNYRLNSDLCAFFIGGMLLFSLQFTNVILDTKLECPRIHNYLNLLKGMILFIALLVFVVEVDLNPIMAGLSIVASLSILSTGIYSFTRTRRGMTFILGWTAYLGGVILYALSLFGFLTLNFFTYHAKEVGIMLELILLAFAQADRIRILTKERELANKKIQTALQQTSKDKDAFLAALSHELRTPLNGIVLPLEELEAEIKDKHQRQQLSLSLYSSRKMLNMVDCLLDLSELKCDKFKLKESSYDIYQSLQRLLQNYKTRCESKGLGFTYVISKGFPQFVVGDALRTVQILHYFLDNAVKFTHRGSLHFSALHLNDRIDEQGRSNFSFLISDSGIGFDKQSETEAFKAFNQAESGYNRGEGGLGIGLTLATNIIEKMQGEVLFSTREHSGTLFHIRIPFLPAAEGQPVCLERDILYQGDSSQDDAIGNAQEKGHETKILIVEDQDVNLMILKRIVTKLGYETLTAKNGQEAVDILQEAEVDMILMDCQMPVMDGFEATKNIRTLTNKNKDVPIIAITANSETDAEERCINAGMNCYQKKPINKSQLVENFKKFGLNSLAS